MYISVNDVLINYDFNPFVNVRVVGKDLTYLVESREYKKNHHIPLLLESYIVSNSLHLERPNFVIPIEFYFDFEITIYKFLDGHGIKKIFNHRFDETGKLIRVILETPDEKEALLWYEIVMEYQKLHSCKICVESDFDKVNNYNNSLYYKKDLSYYKTYKIGRYPKASNDFMTIDPRTEGFIQFGYWKKFWSYQHPTNWVNLSSEQIAKEILGL